MNTRLKLGIVLAAVAGVLLATAGSYAYAQSTTQQSSQANCRSMNNTGEMGMMGGMSHYGSMSRDQCRAQMGQQNMGQCQDFMASAMSTQPYSMMQDQNATSACY